MVAQRIGTLSPRLPFSSLAEGPWTTKSVREESSDNRTSASKILAELLGRTHSVRRKHLDVSNFGEECLLAQSAPTKSSDESKGNTWEEPFVVERHRGLNARTYKVHVAGRDGAARARPPDRPRSRIAGAAAQRWDLHSNTLGSLFVVDTEAASGRASMAASPSLEEQSSVPPPVTLIADTGARPWTKRHAWPVLVAAGVVAPEEDSKEDEKAPQEDNTGCDSDDWHMSEAWKKHFQDKGKAKTRLTVMPAGGVAERRHSILATVVRDASDVRRAAALRHEPFRAGGARPRLLERKFGPLDADDPSKRDVYVAPTMLSSVLRTLSPRVRAAQRKVEAAKAPEQPVNVVPTADKPRKGVEVEEPSPKSKEVDEKIGKARGFLKAMHSKHSRLEKIRRLRKISKNSRQCHHDRVCSTSSVQLADEAFERHFGEQDFLFTFEALLEALADFGLKASTRVEKSEVRALTQKYNEGDTITFDAFLAIIEETRLALRNLHAQEILNVCNRVEAASNTDDHGYFTHSQILRVLTHFGLQPANVDEEDVVDVMIEELDKTKTGLVVTFDIGTLVQQVQEMKQAARREKERDLQEAEDIPESLFTEFRSQMLDIYDSFQSVDAKRQGVVNADGAMMMLSQFGCIEDADDETRTEIAELVKKLAPSSPHENEGLLNFAGVLSLMRHRRRITAQDMEDSVMELFKFYSRQNADSRAELSVNDQLRLLSDMGLTPTSPEEQECIANLMDEFDVQGVGYLSVEDTTNLAQRVHEKLIEVKRRKEAAKAVGMGFTRVQAIHLRHAFAALDEDRTGLLDINEVDTAVRLMGWKLTNRRLRKFFEDTDEDGSGQLDFTEFLSLMRRVDEEVKANGTIFEEIDPQSADVGSTSSPKGGEADEKPRADASGAGGGTGGKRMSKISFNRRKSKVPTATKLRASVIAAEIATSDLTRKPP